MRSETAIFLESSSATEPAPMAVSIIELVRACPRLKAELADIALKREGRSGRRG